MERVVGGARALPPTPPHAFHAFRCWLKPMQGQQRKAWKAWDGGTVKWGRARPSHHLVGSEKRSVLSQHG